MKISLSALRKILGKITDVLLIGRNKGWWSQGQGPKVKALLASLILFGAACASLPQVEIDCLGGKGCPDGTTCKPRADFPLWFTCQPDTPPVTVPPASPAPSPSPTPPIVSPSMPPTPPDPPASPSPTPKPSPTPDPAKPWKCRNGIDDKPDPVTGKDCMCPDFAIDWAVRTCNWVVPRNSKWPGSHYTECSQDGNPPRPIEPYDWAWGNGYAYSTGEGRQRVDRLINHVDRDGNILHKAERDGYTGRICQPPSPAPPASPTPVPPPASPAPPVVVGNNFPPPPAGQCNATYAGQVSRMGINVLTQRDCGEDCRKKGYLGYVLNFSATPKSKPPYCGHAPDRLECEQHKGCQDGINDLENSAVGPQIFLTMPGKFTNDVCDKRSDNTFNCHHKPKKDETGILTVTACPQGASPSDPRCSSRRFDVQEHGFSEVPNR